MRAIPLLLFALTACGGLDPSGPHPEFATTLPPPATVMASSNGAIFQATTGYAALTSGNRAARVGDILTIRLVERTIAAKSNSAATSRSGTFGLTPPSTGPLALFSGSDINTGGNQSFSGDGKAAQSNSLSGEISVTVAEVFANGSMRITGEKLLNLNRGQESVRLSGLVRAADIGADNRVLSTNVADARIAYSGSGEIARASKQGWLQKFFSAVSPF